MAERFNIELEVLGGITPSQEAVFSEAANRWSQVISAGVPPVVVDGVQIDDLRITAQGLHIDDVGGTLGRAGPTAVRPGSLIPATGIMEFDTADLRRMEQDGGLLSVAIHEMGHVLGIGTLWGSDFFDLIAGSGTANPVFTGESAMREFGTLLGTGPQHVPLSNTGGPGTLEGHWRESVFGNELMTGFLNVRENPMSRMTIASLEDLGYSVDLTAADAFQLPSALQIAMMGIGADHPREFCCMCGTGTRDGGIRILPDDSLVQAKKARASRVRRTRRSRDIGR